MSLAILLLTIAIELLVYLPGVWRVRIALVVLLSAATPAATLAYILNNPSLLGGLILLLAAGRLFNYLRVAEARMHERYLYTSTRRTSIIFCGIQALLAGAYWFWPHALDPNNRMFLLSLSTAQVVAAAVFAVSTWRTLQRSQYIHDTAYLSDKELPTVTIAIPARNETTDLEACLRTALASNYPKLEIIVLDDCSQLKTSEIIKSFAHAGVRFIKGAEPDDRWLAKNQAYQRLAEEASGEIILFCGVDVRFGSNAVRALVTALTLRNKDMISVMPHRLDGSPAAAFIQPIRYWWEVALPRRLFRRPAVLSTVWLIKRDVLQKAGGFAAVSRAIIPEAYFARKLSRQFDSYSFMRASHDLDVQTVKSTREQRDTALRVRYPQIHRRPENALLLAVVETALIFAPIFTIVWAYSAGSTAALVASTLATLLLVLVHVTIVYVTNPGNVAIALINFPMAAVTEMYIGALSMVRYEFGSVMWKDRNVCVPVMHAYPKLSKLTKK